MRSVLIAVRNAVVGWTPNASDTLPFELQSGRLEKYSGATLWWQEVYRANYTLEAA